MQSFQNYKVSEFLKDRHPYVDPPFTSEIDPSQVTLGVFFRKIPKLADCLEFENLPYHLRTDALHTLNELVPHQESKDTMINLNVLKSCGVLLQSESANVRKESALLIGGIVTLMQGRGLLVQSEVFGPLKEKLTDSERVVRTAVAWTLKRILISRDGVDRIVETETVQKMVAAFLKYAKVPKDENKEYLMELLSGFVSISQYDNGINPMLGTGLMQGLIDFLASSNVLEGKAMLHELTLNVVSNMALNHTGKAEACEAKAIEAVGGFLQKKASPEQQRLSAAVIMAVTIALEGKYQAVRIEKSGQNIILKRLYNLLLGNTASIRNNAKQCFANIAELPEGFDKSVVILSQNIGILDEVFGIHCIKPLVRLLPRLSSYSEPPKLDRTSLSVNQRCILSLTFLLDKYDEKGLIEAIDTVNIAQKLSPFLSTSSGVHNESAHLLLKICTKDSHNKELLKSFLSQYSDPSIHQNLGKLKVLLEAKS